MEEKISAELKLSELRQQAFRRTFDQIRDQASSILLLNLQWEEIDRHFHSTFTSVENCYKEHQSKGKELEEREKELHSKEKAMEEREQHCEERNENLQNKSREIEWREKEFAERCEEFIKLKDAEIEEQFREIDLKKKDLEERRKEFQGIELKEKECEERWKELELEAERLEERQKEVQEREELIEKKFVEIKLKEKQIDEGCREVEWENRKSVEEIELKEKQLDERRKEIELENKKLEEKASSVLVLSLHWKDVEAHFDSVRSLIQSEKEEVEKKSREIEERETCCKDKERLVDERIKEVGEIQERLDELFKQVKSKDAAFKEWGTELETKEIEFGEKVRRMYDYIELKEQRVEEESREIAQREKRVALKERQVEQLFKEVRSRDEDFRERKKGHELKEKEIALKDRKAEDKLKEIASKEKEIESKDRKAEERLREIGSKETEFGQKEKAFKLKHSRAEERLKEIVLKEKVLELKEEKVEERFKEIDLKEKGNKLNNCKDEERIKEIELMERKVGLRSKEIEMNRRELEDLRKELELKCRKVEERSEEVELKEKEYDLKAKRIEGLELREKKLEERLRDVELENKKFLEQIKAFESASKPSVDACNVRVKTEQVDYSTNVGIHFSVKMDGKELQIFLNERDGHHSEMKGEVLTALQRSSDPAKLVLDAMEGYYPPHLRKGNVEFRERVVKRSCNLLLAQLRKIAPPIKPHVRGEAMKLAFDWMTKMKAEDFMDVLGFFHLLVAYGLASAFDSDELVILLVTIAQDPETPEFFRVLGLAEKVSAFIQNLISRKQYIEAIRYISAFKMFNQFSPGALLRGYLSNSKLAVRKIRNGSTPAKAHVKATNKRLADLRAVLKCIEDYKLESEYSADLLKQQMRDVKRHHWSKTTLSNQGCKPQHTNPMEKKCLPPKVASPSPVTAPPSAPIPKNKQQEQVGNKRPQPQHQVKDKRPQGQHEGGNKRPRIATSSEVPLKASSQENTDVLHSAPFPGQQAEDSISIMNQGASYLKTSAQRQNFTRYMPVDSQVSFYYDNIYRHHHSNSFGKTGCGNATPFPQPWEPLPSSCHDKP